MFPEDAELTILRGTAMIHLKNKLLYIHRIDKSWDRTILYAKFTKEINYETILDNFKKKEVYHLYNIIVSIAEARSQV